MLPGAARTTATGLDAKKVLLAAIEELSPPAPMRAGDSGCGFRTTVSEAVPDSEDEVDESDELDDEPGDESSAVVQPARRSTSTTARGAALRLTVIGGSGIGGKDKMGPTFRTAPAARLEDFRKDFGKDMTIPV